MVQRWRLDWSLDRDPPPPPPPPTGHLIEFMWAPVLEYFYMIRLASFVSLKKSLLICLFSFTHSQHGWKHETPQTNSVTSFEPGTFELFCSRGPIMSLNHKFYCPFWETGRSNFAAIQKMAQFFRIVGIPVFRCDCVKSDGIERPEWSNVKVRGLTCGWNGSFRVKHNFPKPCRVLHHFVS